ncbi:PH domain-containing protein [Natronomonas amylolytica]|uniref:PH domain-containing protein n=1 Tax=Natronomonas amylolytica TaxID=3108498 RepID=UPI00300A983F
MAAASTDSPSLEWLTLDDDEELLWSSRPHRSSLVPALVVGIPLSFVLVGIPILVGAYLTYQNTHYVVTDAGLYKKTGILSRDVQKIGFDKVQNTSYSQSAIGGYFGYGNVDISTAGGSGVEMRFRSVPDPADVQQRINKRVKSKEPASDDKSEVLEEVLDELRAIRAELEAR